MSTWRGAAGGRRAGVASRRRSVMFCTGALTACIVGGLSRPAGAQAPDSAGLPGATGASGAGRPAADTARVESGRVDTGRMDPVTAATHEYRRTGVARVVEEGTAVTYPFGHSQPTVTCAPLRACVVELQAGESVVSEIAGDTQRWEIQLASAGVDGRTSLVVVKPHDCALTTNLVLATTSGRIYDLTLDSPPCERGTLNPRGIYTRRVRFYYPDAMVQAWAPPPAAAHPDTMRGNGQAPGRGTGPVSGIDALNFAYRLRADHRFPWRPVAVFDDGAHCYIKLPPHARHRDVPVLFAVGEDGTRTLLNYSIVHDTYVTDRVVRGAQLVLTDGDEERVLRIENLDYDAPPDDGSRASHADIAGPAAVRGGARP